MVAVMPEMGEKLPGESCVATLRQHFRPTLARDPLTKTRDVRASTGAAIVWFLPSYSGRAGYPGLGGGLWLRMIFPPGLRTWLVPSGWTVSFQPSLCSTTWWCQWQ
jgi:hypothetical protein